jgi:hypothetical protein
VDRDDEIGGDLGDDYERKRASKTDLMEYLDEPLLANRGVKQSWGRKNYFNAFRYWRYKTRDWPKFSSFCRFLYATVVASVIFERSFSFTSRIFEKNSEARSLTDVAQNESCLR